LMTDTMSVATLRLFVQRRAAAIMEMYHLQWGRLLIHEL
jgi:hypothetical protein